MPVRSCRVTIQDMDGIVHIVEVTAGSLYEAVAQGLAAIRGNEWVAGIAQGSNVARVSVADVRVDHEVISPRAGFAKLDDRRVVKLDLSVTLL